MSSETLFIILGILGGLGVLVWLLNKKLAEFSEKQKPSEELLRLIETMQSGMVEQNKNLQQALRGTNKDITSSLQENTKQLNDRLDRAAEVIREVGKEVGQMSEIGRGMKDLQEFLRSPKLRGNIGEHVLKELLTQMLPKQSFYLQYGFKNGQVVDALVETSSGKVPIDSKFPMESFRGMMKAKDKDEKSRLDKQFVNEVRKHIRDISSKYILTDEGTIDYALMYVPSEAVYYEVVNSPELFDYAGEKRVLPVSPTTFYAYMKAILMSFEGQKIEARAKEILSALRSIQSDYGKVEESLGTLGKHVNNAYNMMNTVAMIFSQLGQKISSTQALGDGEAKKAEQLEMKAS